MALYAFLQGGTVAHISPVKPAMTSYTVIEVDEETPPNVGDVYDQETGAFTTPVFVPPSAPEQRWRTVVSRAEYYGLFTPVEEAMIRMTADQTITRAQVDAATGAAKQALLGVAAMAVMLRRTDALEPSATFDLATPQVGQGLDLLVTLGLITGKRKTEILKGVPV